MLLRELGVLRAVRSVVVLGAGASRGASFVGPGRQVLPPLDADFFSQAQQLDEKSYARYARPVIQFIRDEYGLATVPTLESLFTQLEGFEQFLKQFSTGPGRRTERYRKQLVCLRALIPAVFRAALADSGCAWHDRIAYAMRKGDAVVSFNYDTLIDESLRRWASGIWNARKGYGFPVAVGADEWNAKATPGPLTKDYVRLMKPHGSLHWTKVDTDNQSLQLHSEPYAQRSARGNVIPPTWDKTVLSDWPWKRVWEESSRLLQQARCLIVIGYSVPATDLMSQALIKSSLGAGTLRLLVTVNPDPDARAKVADLARAAIGSSTRIIELDTLEEFGSTLDETPTQRSRRSAHERTLRRLRAQLEVLDERADDLEIRLDDVDLFEARIEALEAQVES